MIRQADSGVSRPGGRPVDVLVVDDERHVRDVMSRFLALAGYKVRQAYDVPSARTLIAESVPDLVFLDINMPGPSGLELLAELAPLWPEVAAVMSTAVGDLETAMEAIRKGAADYLQKPVNLQTVKLVAERTLERRRLTIENRDYQFHLEALVEKRTEELRLKTVQILRTQAALVYGLCRLAEFRDAETGGHLERMSIYSQILAERLSSVRTDLPKDFAKLMRQAAPLHDIGKVGVPDAVLLKTETLTEDEFELIKRHTIIGAETLQHVRKRVENDYAPFLDIGMEICIGHHERWDGHGYPFGRGGDDIPISARVAAVADYFDACTSSRIYRPEPMPFIDVRNEISVNAGKAFDAQVVEAFVAEEERIYNALKSHDGISEVTPFL